MLDADPPVRDVIEIVAVLGPTEIAELDDLGGPDTTAAALRAIDDGHLLLAADDSVVTLASPVRGTSMRDVLRRERPDRVTALLERQSDLRLDSGRLDCGLTAARTLGDPTRLGRIIDRWGVDLAHGPYAATMFEVTAELPVELASSLPGLAFRFEDIGRLPIGTTRVRLPRTAEEAEAEFTRDGDVRLRQALLPLVTRRRLGRFDDAMAIVRAATPLAEACVYPWYGDKGRILPYWYLQAGITAQLAGDLATARTYFLNAWTHRARDPYGFVARGTAGKLALMDAFRGDHAAGAGWRKEAEAAGRRPDLWVDRFVESNLPAVRAIVAVDGLDPQADLHLAATPHPTQRGEQWSILLWIHVRHALTSGDTAQARRCLADTLATQREALSRTGLAAALVPLLRAEVHLAMGQANQALTELTGAPDVAGAARVLRARVLLLARDPAAALTVAETVVQDESTSPRARTEALVLITAARSANDDRPGAVTAARRAAARVLEQGAYRALATVPRSILDDLVTDVPALAELLDVLDRRGITEIYPKSVDLVTVTRRERDLLVDLASGLSLPDIAKANFVSVNTTRTHLASLRRKLDARSREEVVLKARLLGLLADDPVTPARF
ncbi:helix-turn-helix transcriptional regulator [Nocardioides carbamazepini]|uniref:helix-turn-helix transcriptional regulator n=1 Tax=Nocardioides carbamazepini TaxID=2854259 RepID=UPI002149B7E4|nr:helix-turn-helix transcriptional regulator [Nocardioides carbamazepini]MCR1785277.1 helix-turn-helix transcriptional regulator [Nocardioides carbamazepini]